MAVKLIASSALIGVPSYLTKMFLQQRLVELGWPTELLFLPLLLGGLACGGHRGRPPGEMPLHAAALHSLCPALRCGNSAGGYGARLGGILGMMLVQGVWRWCLHESQKLNDAIPSDQRATLISVDGMAYSLLMIPGKSSGGCRRRCLRAGRCRPCPAGRGKYRAAQRRGALGEIKPQEFYIQKSGCVPVGAHPLCYFAKNRRQVSGIKNTSMGKISRRPASMSKIITSLAGSGVAAKVHHGAYLGKARADVVQRGGNGGEVGHHIKAIQTDEEEGAAKMKI